MRQLLEPKEQFSGNNEELTVDERVFPILAREGSREYQQTLCAKYESVMEGREWQNF